jgi:predicted nucleic acid-binding protein
VIIYLDSSVLARSYLVDEVGHEDALAILERTDVGLVTGTWSRIEVTGALVRAAKGGRFNLAKILRAFESDIGTGGRISLITAPHELVEDFSLKLVLEHGIRAMDAWHLATGSLAIPSLLEPGEDSGFATRDNDQKSVAERLGFLAV